MIYFIRGKQSGYIKIGYTGGDGQSRLAQLQTGSPEELELLGGREGGVELERAYHDRFASQRVRGEWFQTDHRLSQHISWIQSGHPTIHGKAIRSVYLAGKISGTTWRDEIAPGWSKQGWVHGESTWAHRDMVAEVLDRSGMGEWRVRLTGPYWLNMNEGHCCDSSGGPSQYGLGDHSWGEYRFFESRAQHKPIVDYVAADRPLVAQMAKDAILGADLVFAWVDCLDCYGTLAEIGLAAAAGAVVVVAGPSSVINGEVWLAAQFADIRIEDTTPKRAWHRLFWTA